MTLTALADAKRTGAVELAAAIAANTRRLLPDLVD